MRPWTERRWVVRTTMDVAAASIGGVDLVVATIPFSG
jgi:hypothetical protein